MAAAPPRRPVYLFIAMLALWIVGIHEADEGFGVLRAIVDPLFGGSSEILAFDAFLSAIRVHHRQLLPAYAAQLVINVTMFLVAVRLLFTGRANLAFTLQVIGVNMLVLGYAYYVSLPLRVAHVSALAVTPEIQNIAREAGEDPAVAVAVWWWAMRGSLFAELSLLLACGFALTRPRAQHFIQWASRSTAGSD